MPIKPSSLLKLSVAGVVLLSVGACKPADKGQGALISKGVEALNLSKSEAGVFSKYFKTDPCEVDEMESLGALAGLGLGETGNDGLSFKDRQVENGRVTFSDLMLKEDGANEVAFSAKSAVFHCPQMGDEAPSFSRLDLTDVFIRDEGDDVEFTAKTVNIANPTPDAARSVVESISKPNAKSVNDIGFGAISVTGAEIKSKELYGTMASLSWGEIRDENGLGKADMTIDSVNLVAPGKNGTQDMTFDFDGLSARNMNIGAEINPTQNLSTNQMIENILGNVNAFEKPYDELIIETLKVNAQGFAVDFGGIEGQTSEKSGVITTRQSLKPTLITLKPALGDNPSFQQQYELIKSLDMETIKLSGSSVTTLDSADDSITVSDGLFVVEDVYRLNFEYEAEGLGEVTDKLQSLSAAETSAAGLGVYDALKLRSLRLTLEDNSIVAKGLKIAAEMTGQSEKNIKRMLGGAVFAAAMAAENDVQAEVYSETAEAFADFVKKGGTLTIEANPPAPFSLSPLISGKGADVDPESLGFSASQDGGTE